MKKIYTIILFCAVAMFMAKTASAQIDEMLVYYQFNEGSGTDVIDESGNGNDGYTNTDTSWTDGFIDGAILFEGSQVVNLPAQDIGLTSEEGTVAFWMLSADKTSNINTMFWACGVNVNDLFNPHNIIHVHMEGTAGSVWAGGEVSFVIFDSIGDTRYFIYSDPWDGGLGQAPSDQGVLVNDSTWHHVAASWGGGKLGLYVDGETIWDTTAYYGNTFDINFMTIGSQNQATSRNFNGIIDEFRLYDVALDQQTINDIYLITDKNEIQQDIEFSVYPNPATDVASLRFMNDEVANVSVNLYSVSGARLGNLYSGSASVGENILNLNTAAYESGMYMIEMSIGDKVSYTKLVLE